MPSGGYRPGAGRKPKGSERSGKPPVTPVKPERRATNMRRKAVEQGYATGKTPLEYMLDVMRDENIDKRRRDQMAMAAAPYMHPRLAAIEHSGETIKRVIKDTPPTSKEWAEKHKVETPDPSEMRH